MAIAIPGSVCSAFVDDATHPASLSQIEPQQSANVTADAGRIRTSTFRPSSAWYR